MKKVLLLEDDISVLDATRNAFHSALDECEITTTSSLIALNKMLFTDPGVDEFDFVCLDLAIDMGSLPASALRKALPKMFTGPDGMELPKAEAAGIRLYGLEYYKNVIWRDPKFRDCRTTKFILITGHVNLVERYKLLSDCKGVKIVKKSGEGTSDDFFRLLRQ